MATATLAQPKHNITAYKRPEAAEYYDLLAPTNAADIVRFWKFICADYAARPIENVLELGVGTGRFAIPLVKEGYEVVGIDQSSSMLNHCRAKCRKEKVDMHLYEQRIENFVCSPKSFDAVACIFGTLAFLVDYSAMQRAITNYYNALRPGGFLLLDVANSMYWLANQWSKYNPMRVERWNGNKKEVVEQMLRMEPNCLEGTLRYTNTITAHCEPNGKTHLVQDEYTLRMFSWPEIQLLLDPFHYFQVLCFGDWTHRHPYLNPSHRLIVVAIK